MQVNKKCTYLLTTNSSYSFCFPVMSLSFWTQPLDSLGVGFLQGGVSCLCKSFNPSLEWSAPCHVFFACKQTSMLFPMCYLEALLFVTWWNLFTCYMIKQIVDIVPSCFLIYLSLILSLIQMCVHSNADTTYNSNLMCHKWCPPKF